METAEALLHREESFRARVLRKVKIPILPPLVSGDSRRREGGKDGASPLVRICKRLEMFTSCIVPGGGDLRNLGLGLRIAGAGSGS